MFIYIYIYIYIYTVVVIIMQDDAPRNSDASCNYNHLSYGNALS